MHLLLEIVNWIDLSLRWAIAILIFGLFVFRQSGWVKDARHMGPITMGFAILTLLDCYDYFKSQQVFDFVAAIFTAAITLLALYATPTSSKKGAP